MIIRAPSSVVTYPTNNAKVSSLSAISGTGTDYPAGTNAGVGLVKVNIKNTANGNCWTGSSWTNIEFWVDSSGTDNWTYSTVPAWGNGLTYILSSKGTG